MPPSDREAFRTQLVELLALKTADELGDITLPAPAQMEKYRSVAEPRAEQVLRNYEKSLLVNEIHAAVIEKLRDDLVARSRAAKLIEVAINVSLLVIGGLIGLSQFIFDPVQNRAEIAAVYYSLLAVVALQLVANLYLKYFDSNR